MQKDMPPQIDSQTVKAHIYKTWAQTIFGIGSIAVLTAAILLFCGFRFSIITPVLLVLTIWPITGWFFSGSQVKKLMRCQEPNLADPDHAMFVRLAKKVFPKSGLTVMPQLYISPIPMANMFATGRGHATAMIVATHGIFDAKLTEDEFEAVLGHEMSHIKNRDLAITSMLAAMGSLFSLVLATALPGLFNACFTHKSDAPLLNKLAKKVDTQKRRFAAETGVGITMTIFLYYIIGAVMKLVTLFVTRARESAADAYSALWTGNPCAMSSALQKLVSFEHNNRNDIMLMVLTRGLSPAFIVSPFGEDETEDGGNPSLSKRLSRWWRRLGLMHPPVPERLKMLDALSGSSCPRL
jgi:heat shock protein HtpX